jgi:hypothetical protein
MPELGEIKRGRDLGKKYKNGAYIFSACEICGSERWVECRDGKAKDKRCYKCVNKGKTGIKLTHPNKDIVANVGDIKTGEELGLNFKTQRYIYETCPNCRNNRWVQIQSAGKYPKCRKCINKGKVGENNGHWNGGRKVNKGGYIEVLLQPDDPYYPMATKSGYVREHRLAIAKKLGRCLEKWEEVHHKGETFPVQSKQNKSDNIPENLLLVGAEGHNTMIEKTLIRLESENKELKALLKTDMSVFI